MVLPIIPIAVIDRLPRNARDASDGKIRLDILPQNV